MEFEWEEDPHAHTDDQDNLRRPHAFLPDASTPQAASGWQPYGEQNAGNEEAARRLDYLLPLDGETGVTAYPAACIYLDAMIEMVSRHAQPLSVLSIAVDDSPILRFLGKDGAAIIGRAVARCLRQETRTHDVVGHADREQSPDAFTFLVTCPLLTEEQAANLGERLRAAMTAHSGDEGRPWLTLSVGVASLSLDVTDSRSLMARSMEALRRARRKGGSRVWRHTDTTRSLMERSEDEENEGRNGPGSTGSPNE